MSYVIDFGPADSRGPRQWGMEGNTEEFLQEPETKSRLKRSNIVLEKQLICGMTPSKSHSGMDGLVTLTPKAQPCNGSAVAGLSGRLQAY